MQTGRRRRKSKQDHEGCKPGAKSTNYKSRSENTALSYKDDIPKPTYHEPPHGNVNSLYGTNVANPGLEVSDTEGQGCVQSQSAPVCCLYFNYLSKPGASFSHAENREPRIGLSSLCDT